MPEVRTLSPDFKVLFRRLIVPGELGRDLNLIQSPSQAIGEKDTSTGMTAAGRDQLNSTLTRARAEERRSLFIKNLFDNYVPKQFTKDVLAKADIVSKDFVALKQERDSDLATAQKQVKEAQDRLAAVSVSKAGNSDLMKVEQATALRDAIDSLKATMSSGVAADRSVMVNLRTIQVPALRALPNLAVNSVESSVVESIDGAADILSNTANLTEDTNNETQGYLIQSIQTILDLRASVDGQDADRNTLRQLISSLSQQVDSIQADIDVLKASDDLRPFYDPILLDSLIGPTGLQTSGTRGGQPGTASMTFHLPLDAQGEVPPLFMGFRVEDIFGLDMLEAQPTTKSAGVSGTVIPSQTLSILQPSLRETTVMPFDMIQVWGKKRFSAGAAFPGDYYPVFTGFVTKVGVGYVGSTITVTVSAEDVGKLLRLSRVNIDPSLDPRFRVSGIRVTAFNNFLASNQFKSGAKLIEGLIVGAPGTFLGLSQAEVVTKTVQNEGQGGQSIPQFQIRAKPVALASDFQNLKLNLWEDLLNRWKPYATQFKNAFRIWETDAKTKWEICREVADITEFEFYADNMGVINYHPPLYFLNPFTPQYFIEDVEVEAENHVYDEAEVLTVCEVHSQPGFNLDRGALGVARNLDSLIAAPDAVVQRFGVRWQKKEVPIFSGTEEIPDKSADAKTRERNRNTGRDGYARAWMNRRNANIRTATVTIPFTPEIRLCNTVAFVGDLKQTMKTIATNQIAAASSGLTGVPSAFPLIFSGSYAAGATSVLRGVLVYYVSGVTHGYNQGGRATTTLTLTHGRHWTDCLPPSSVGYGLDGTDSDTVYQMTQQGFGQDGVNVAEFAKAVNNRLQFQATGDTSFITGSKIDDGVFGFTARTPVASIAEKVRLKLASEVQGLIEKTRASVCTKLFQETDPDDVHKEAASRSTSISASISGIFTKLGDALKKAYQDLIALFSGKISLKAKFLSLVSKFIDKKVEEQKKALENVLNQAEEALFNKLLGGKYLKILVELPASAARDVSDLTSAQVLAPFRALGVDLTRYLHIEGGVVFYVFVVRSDISYDNAVSTYRQGIIARTAEILGEKNVTQNPGQVKTYLDQVVLSATVQHTTVALSSTSKATTKTIYFLQGVMVCGSKVEC